MGRPTVKINPKRGERLKQIIKEQKITQLKLSELTGYSQQSISRMVNGKDTVSDTMANLVIELYPEYRFEWLMGFDDFKTKMEEKFFDPLMHIIQRSNNKKAVEAFLKVYGLSFELDCDVDCTLDEFIELPEKEGTDIMEKILSSDFRLQSEKGEVLFRCSDNEKREFVQEICDFVEFKINKMVERKNGNG